MGSGLEHGYQRITSAVEMALQSVPPASSPRLLLENSAGTGNNVGGRFEELAELLQRLAPYRARTGVCFDTAHAHSAGYDMSPEGVEEAVAQLDRTVGLDRVFVVHANDTQVDVGAKRDVHWHIGEGHLGEDTFFYLLTHEQLRDRAFILETPGEEMSEGRRNLERLRSLLR
jgi:deoxyribonuclease-4